jgi:ketosteroid isomerase-like protein
MGVRKASVTRSSTKRRPITTKFLDAFADAWNRHDVDRLMTFMSDDCVFEASAVPAGSRGRRCAGLGA